LPVRNSEAEKGDAQRTRLGDGGALSCVTLGRLPLNKGIKVEFKLLLFG
jgi:hypothetical protein